jgi:hypothetical protein
MPTVYVALFVGDPAGAGVEVSQGGYSRKQTAGTDWEAASSGATQNTNAIAFGTATESWGTVDYFAVYDAASAGNMLGYGALTQSKAIGSGDTASFAAGDLDFDLT